jgi:hypothetical protein
MCFAPAPSRALHTVFSAVARAERAPVPPQEGEFLLSPGVGAVVVCLVTNGDRALADPVE